MSIPLAQLLLVFFRAGILTFGGGLPTIAALEHELVERRRWLGHEQFSLAFAVMRVTPGTNVLAFCAGAAWQMKGWAAAVLAVLAIAIPTGILVVLLARMFDAGQSYPLASAALTGASAGAIGMMCAAAWSILRPQMRGRDAVIAISFAAASAVLEIAGVNPAVVLIAAAAAGLLWR